MTFAPDNAIAQISVAQRVLTSTRTFSEVLEIRDRAAAVSVFATAKGADRVAQAALELKLRAERRAGEFLARMKEAGEFGRGRKSVTLTDLGIRECESRRWQRLALIPDPRFEAYISLASKKSQATLLRLANEVREEAVRRNPGAVSNPDGVSVRLLGRDFAEAEIADESIDLVLTDAPYGEAFLPQFDCLGRVVARVLKPGGWLVMYVGKMFLPMVLLRLSRHLAFWWVVAVQLPGNHHVLRDFYEDWRLALVFFKPPHSPLPQPFGDHLVNPKPEKRFHVWGQGKAPFLALLDGFSKPGDWVLDPMAGGGTVVEACVEKRRNVIACENDPDAYAVLRKRFPPGTGGYPQAEGWREG